jgi:hypothetical protein
MRTAPPELTAGQLAEQVELLRSLIGHGATLADLDAQFAGNFQPEQWQQIRAALPQPRPR